MVCSLWVPCLPLLGFLGSLGALVHCPASSRERKAPTEPVIFTLFCWSGLLSWCRSGSTCGYYNCSLFLWPVTHTHRHTNRYVHTFSYSSSVGFYSCACWLTDLVWVLKKLVVRFGMKSFAERTLTSWWTVLEKFGREREEALLPGPIKGLAQFLLRIDTKVM